PDQVFPLLCPVREHDWLEHWRADMLYTDTGLAETGCVFVTHLASVGPCTWVIHQHEPPTSVGFTIMCAGVFVELLTIELAAADGGTTLVWRRVLTGLREDPGDILARRAAAYEPT